ncbi:hypothetical protein Esti_003982 [Eimeria stiedai]
MGENSLCQWLQTVWRCCISPPAVWGQDGYYPVCFSSLLISLSAFMWYRLGESSNIELFVLPLLPNKNAKILLRQLNTSRAVVASHEQVPQNAGVCTAAAASSPPQRCPVCRSELEAEACLALSKAKGFLATSRNRVVGGLHAAAATLLAICCLSIDSRLRGDKAKGTSFLFTLLGVMTSGYFCWDVYIILKEWGPGSLQWFVHAFISGSSVSSPFLFPSSTPMCYYAASMLLFEASTPFFCMRYFLLKAECGAELAGRLVHALFLVSFFSIRIVYGCLFLFPEVWELLLFDPEISRIAFHRKALYLCGMPLFGALQFVWFLKLIFPARKITNNALSNP